jgi:hypothetical protein
MTEERTKVEEREEVEDREEGAELEPVLRPPPTPPFFDHPLRVLCTFCFAGNREL